LSADGSSRRSFVKPERPIDIVTSSLVAVTSADGAPPFEEPHLAEEVADAEPDHPAIGGLGPGAPLERDVKGVACISGADDDGLRKRLNGRPRAAIASPTL
jgi:hypothetical protein